MGDPQLDLEGLEPTEDDLRRAYEGGCAEGFTFEQALATPHIRKGLVIAVWLERKRKGEEKA